MANSKKEYTEVVFTGRCPYLRQVMDSRSPVCDMDVADIPCELIKIYGILAVSNITLAERCANGDFRSFRDLDSRIAPLRRLRFVVPKNTITIVENYRNINK